MGKVYTRVWVPEHRRSVRLHRVEVNIRPENTPSLRVVEKLQLREEGLRPRYLHIDGDWRDHRCFAVHAEEVADTGGLLPRLLDGRPPGSRSGLRSPRPAWAGHPTSRGLGRPRGVGRATHPGADEEM